MLPVLVCRDRKFGKVIEGGFEFFGVLTGICRVFQAGLKFERDSVFQRCMNINNK